MAPTTDRKPGIVVIEDEAIARTLLRAQLERLGFPVSEAASATRALALLQRRPFALALIDLQLPELSGTVLLQRVRGSPGPNRNMKAIAISAKIDADQERRLRQAGFDAWLCKPVAVERLQALVRNWLAPEGATEKEGSDGAGEDDRLTRIQTDLQAKFLADLRGQLSRIESTLERHPRQALEHIHKLHGAAGFCHFEALQRWAAHLEIALREGNDVEHRAIWRRLKREAETLLQRGLPENQDSG